MLSSAARAASCASSSALAPSEDSRREEEGAATAEEAEGEVDVEGFVDGFVSVSVSASVSAFVSARDSANALPVGPISSSSENTTPLAPFPLFSALLRSVLSAPLVGGGADATRALTATGALGTYPSTADADRSASSIVGGRGAGAPARFGGYFSTTSIFTFTFRSPTARSRAAAEGDLAAPAALFPALFSSPPPRPASAPPSPSSFSPRASSRLTARDVPNASASSLCSSQQNISRSLRRYTFRSPAAILYFPRPPVTAPAPVVSDTRRTRSLPRVCAPVSASPHIGHPHVPARHRSSHTPRNSSPVIPATRLARWSRDSAGRSMRRSTTRSLSRMASICACATAALARAASGAAGREGAGNSGSWNLAPRGGASGEAAGARGRARIDGRILAGRASRSALASAASTASPAGALAAREDPGLARPDSPNAHCHWERDTRSSTPSGGARSSPAKPAAASDELGTSPCEDPSALSPVGVP